MAWILATKLEMTRIVKDNGFIPVTLLKVPSLKVVAHKTMENDWYDALVVWILKNGSEWVIKDGKKTLSFSDFTNIKEFLVSGEDLEKFSVGSDITLDNLEWVSSVSLTSFSKWKWFTWAMKKHNFSWGPKTHGSKFHRALGSIGNRKPTRTHKGKKMHGHHWNTKVTLKKVPVEILNKDLSVIWLRGPVPGARGSMVMINF